jgi:hypothetical protein
MLCLDYLVYFADPSYILNGQDVYVMLGWFSADPSYILNGQDVYMSCKIDLQSTLNHPSMICRHLDHLRYKMGLH